VLARAGCVSSHKDVVGGTEDFSAKGEGSGAGSVDPSPTTPRLSKTARQQWRSIGDDLKYVTRVLRKLGTRRPGDIVGEMALFQSGGVRNATVRAAEHTDVLILDKKSFLDFDRQTLNIIQQNALFASALTKQPHERGQSDLDVMQERTATIKYMQDAQLSPETHRELCRVCTYHRLKSNATVIKAGDKVDSLWILLSGSAVVRNALPSNMQRAGRENRDSSSMVDKAERRPRATKVNREVSKINLHTLTPGEAVGEEELLQRQEHHLVGVTTSSLSELLQISSADFDRILRVERSSEVGKIFAVFDTLPYMEPVPRDDRVPLARLCSLRYIPSGQLFLAYPPKLCMGSAAFSNEHVYLIVSGEARLLGSTEPDAACSADSSHAVVAPDGALPSNRTIRAALGTGLVPVATLGPPTCVLGNVLQPHAGARWCIEPTYTHMEVLIAPRKEWEQTVGKDAVAAMRELAAKQSDFFVRREAMVRKLVKQGVAAPSLVLGSAARCTLAAMSLSPRNTALIDAARPHGADSKSSSSPLLRGTQTERRARTAVSDLPLLAGDAAVIIRPPAVTGVLSPLAPAHFTVEVAPALAPALASFSLGAAPAAAGDGGAYDAAGGGFFLTAASKDTTTRLPVLPTRVSPRAQRNTTAASYSSGSHCHRAAPMSASTSALAIALAGSHDGARDFLPRRADMHKVTAPVHLSPDDAPPKRSPLSLRGGMALPTLGDGIPYAPKDRRTVPRPLPART